MNGKLKRRSQTVHRIGGRPHKHRTTYDGVGRPTRVERIATSGATSNNVYNAGVSGWDTHGNAWRFDSPGTCLQQPAGVNHPSWYIGTANCQYATGATTGALNLDSPTIALPHGASLTFSYFREVRDEVGLAGNHDRFSVKVEDQTAVGTWTEVYFLDSSQVSWKKWVQSPAISLEAWAGKSVKIRFEFDSVTQNLTTNLRGIGIGQVIVRRLSTVALQETSYDEAFALTGNKPLGKPTSIKDYDEATGAPIFTRELHYVDPNARLSDEILSFDWDRDGANQTLVDSYAYDSRGDLWRQWKPHLQGSSARRYEYSRAFGALIGVTATDEGTGVVQNFIPAGLGDSIQYNDAGGMSFVRFGNGLQQHIEPNADFLTNRIWVDRGTGTDKIFDTGQYLYDGARNIKQIGPGDYYRYDAAMRLTWSQQTSSVYTTVDLDPAYDAFGNMTSQSAVREGSSNNALPNGLVFSGRTYANNRISNASFAYDANGNLTTEPAHDGMTAQRYSFSAEGQLNRITPGVADALPGAAVQAAMYEGGDHRWFRSIWGDGSKAFITLRDASGQVVADFIESNAASGLKLQREYVHANGQLVAINSACGPRPALRLSSPHTVGTTVWFDKTDYVPAVGNYTLHIRTSAGQSKTIGLPSMVGNHFSIGQNELFPNVQNWIEIEAEAECGSTGYSNAVTYIYDPASPSCIKSTGGVRLPDGVSWKKLKVQGVGNCPPATTYNVYYVDPEAEAIELTPLNGSTPVADPSQLLENLPCGSGNGSYWIRPVSSVTHRELASSPIVTMDGTSCGGGATMNIANAPGQPSMNAQYVHWDHLGSTRMVTDEHGVSIAAFKYFPFGQEAEFLGGGEIRKKFTGHERDEGVGLDYMMARSCRIALGRFLEPDDSTNQAADVLLPGRWNRYVYAVNNPISNSDSDGRDVINNVDSPSLRGVVDELARTPIIQDLFGPGSGRDLIVEDVNRVVYVDPESGKRAQGYTKPLGLRNGKQVFQIVIENNDTKTAIAKHEFGHAWLLAVLGYTHKLDPQAEDKAARAGERLWRIAGMKHLLINSRLRLDRRAWIQFKLRYFEVDEPFRGGATVSGEIWGRIGGSQ